MTRTIAALTIALLISAGTEAEAQTGMTIETVYILMENRSFEEVSGGNYVTQVNLPQITQAVWKGGMVFVHQCNQSQTFKKTARLISKELGNALELESSPELEPVPVDSDDPIDSCSPLEEMEFLYRPGKLRLTYYVKGQGLGSRPPRNVLIHWIADNPIIRVTIIAPAEEPETQSVGRLNKRNQ